jgi:hypothetical protein
VAHTSNFSYWGDKDKMITVPGQKKKKNQDATSKNNLGIVATLEE